MVQEYLNFTVESSDLKVIREWERKYEKIDEILRANPEVLNAVHKDLARLSQSRRGRASKYTSDEILRAWIVMCVEGDDYRAAVIRIGTSWFLRSFVGIKDIKPMMDYSFLSRAVGVMRPETLLAMNHALRGTALNANLITGKDCRGDTTVVETNIHYPTDSSLLWDCYRVLARELKRAQRLLPAHRRHRFHPNKIKGLHLVISRYSKSPDKRRQRLVRKAYRLLIEKVRWITRVCDELLKCLEGCIFEIAGLERLMSLAERVVDQAQKRVLEGIEVASTEKLYSIFEDHTELIMRGKANKPIEFGHKIMLVQTREKFISDYAVLNPKAEDRTLVASILEDHERAFGSAPTTLSLDEGFYESRAQLRTLRESIQVVSIRKKGKKTAEEKAIESGEEFRSAQRFRAGIEGSISVLKRAFRLSRSYFKGFKNYAVGVGLAVFCYNLVLLSKL
jgi:IS5 family transposase